MLLGTAASAHAGDTACLWRNTPPPIQSAIIAGYAMRGSDGLADVPMTNDLVRSLFHDCTDRTPSDDQARAAGAALAGQALAEAAAAKLSAAYGVDRRRLSLAWTGLSAADRSVLLRQFARADPTPAEDAQLYGVIRKVAWGLGWRERPDERPLSDPELKAIADYVTGRAQATAFAETF